MAADEDAGSGDLGSLHTPTRRAFVLLGWATMIPVVLGFILARTSSGHTALVVAQVFYLVPVAGAVITTARAFQVGPKGAERAIWGCIALAALLLLCGETYYAWHVVSTPDGLAPLSVFDLFNLGAAALFGAVILTASGAMRLERSALWRLVFDSVAALAVAYIAVYHFWVRNLASDAPWTKEALLAGYSVVGLAILCSLVWLLFGMPMIVRRSYSILAAISIGMFASGMMIAPLWQLPTTGHQGPGGIAIASAFDSVFLCGYYLMMMAGLLRLADKESPWRATMARSLDTEATWPSALLSAVVVVAIALMGRWAFGFDVPQGEATLYVIFATVATAAMVGRVAVTSFETGSLQTISTTDPTTGALNHRAFLELTESQIGDARKKHERFALAVLDLDVFAGVNAAIGHAGGDRVLEGVVRALRLAAGRKGVVFRLSGDEFAVMSPSVTESSQLRFGKELLDAVSAARSVQGVPLSASVGVAMGDGASTPEQLLQRASAAQSWAKYHGKGRVVVYDERIVRALGVEDRLRLHEERAHTNVARALAAAADARDPGNFYHSRNVAALSVLLGEEIGLSTERVREVEVAAMLHDVGKIALAEELLGTGQLSASRERAAREHAALGATLVESLAMPGLPEWIRGHHERWDGGGYPDGLVGESIPLESRVIALADAYDVMTNGKQSAAPLSKAAALQEIDHGMGTRFDPELAERFIEVVAQMRSLGWSDDWPSQ